MSDDDCLVANRLARLFGQAESPNLINEVQLLAKKEKFLSSFLEIHVFFRNLEFLEARH